ncbi:MAG: 4-demethylwyosine synthase TYW1 [Candidatus Micrarchaeota archaeon]
MLESTPNIPEKLKLIMKKQGYHFVGKHSAAKLCNYTISSLKNGTTCYKNQFYGIRSWRCLQSAPTLGCDLACVFCWRIIPEEVGVKWNELNFTEWDNPSDIADGLIEAQRKMLTGYKGNDKVDKKRLEEANDPAHVTFSLTGEPLFYPKMSELIEEFHKRKMSTFLVTNGTLPEALKKLKTLPTQLYVSVQAPNKEVYEKVTRPKVPHAWENFLEFLDVFSKLNTRRVFRLTLIRGLNLVDAKGYAELIKRGNPDYVEVKGFVFVGGARNPSRGLSYGLMPSKEEIINFAKEIAEASGYIFTDYHKPSNVALLSRNEEIASKRLIHFEK